MLELRPAQWNTDIPASGRFDHGSRKDELIITPGDLRTTPFDVALITVVLTNDTDGYVDVFTVDASGAESCVAAGIAHGVAWDGGVRAGLEVLAIRSTFTGA